MIARRAAADAEVAAAIAAAILLPAVQLPGNLPSKAHRTTTPASTTGPRALRRQPASAAGDRRVATARRAATDRAAATDRRAATVLKEAGDRARAKAAVGATKDVPPDDDLQATDRREIVHQVIVPPVATNMNRPAMNMSGANRRFRIGSTISITTSSTITITPRRRSRRVAVDPSRGDRNKAAASKVADRDALSVRRSNSKVGEPKVTDKGRAKVAARTARVPKAGERNLRKDDRKVVVPRVVAPKVAAVARRRLVRHRARRRAVTF